jgi:hypothetical protein
MRQARRRAEIVCKGHLKSGKSSQKWRGDESIPHRLCNLLRKRSPLHNPLADQHERRPTKTSGNHPVKIKEERGTNHQKLPSMEPQIPRTRKKEESVITHDPFVFQSWHCCSTAARPKTKTWEKVMGDLVGGRLEASVGAGPRQNLARECTHEPSTRSTKSLEARILSSSHKKCRPFPNMLEESGEKEKLLHWKVVDCR